MRTFLLLALLLLLPLSLRAEVGFIHESGFHFPAFPPSSSHTSFVDYNSDGNLDLLAMNDSLVVLFDLTSDSIVFSHRVDTLTPHTQTLVDDVNGDSVNDLMIVIAAPDTANTWPSAVDWHLICFDGASNFQDSTTATYHSSTDGLAILGGFPMEFLAATDLNSDGNRELLFSYSTSYYDGISMFSSEGGETVLYYRFPDSISWTQPFRTTQLTSMQTANDSTQFIARIYYAYVSELGPDNGDTEGLLGTLSAIGYFDQMSPDCGDSACAGGGGFRTCSFYAEQPGDFSVTHSGNEILAKLIHNFDCPWDSYFFTEQLLYLFGEEGSGAASVLWSAPIPTNLTELGNFIVHPNLPGYFFGFSGDTLFMFSGENGYMRTSTTDVPLGQRYWETSWPDSIPRLIVMNGHQVDIYSLDVSTEIVDSPDHSLPGSFKFGRPFPNPFNATVTIPITVFNRSQLNVEVFNLLGQPIAKLADREQPVGEWKLTWDAGSLSSGVYLVRAVSGGQTETAKLLLLK